MKYQEGIQLKVLFCDASKALVSFVRNLHVVHLKKTTHKIRGALPSLVQEYVRGTPITDLAKKANYPPYLLARMFVEVITRSNLGKCGGNKKKAIAQVMRHPLEHLTREVIDDDYLSSEIDVTAGSVTRLAREVQHAITSDPLSGPRFDRKRHLIGVEYEVVLEVSLEEMGTWLLRVFVVRWRRATHRHPILNQVSHSRRSGS